MKAGSTPDFTRFETGRTPTSSLHRSPSSASLAPSQRTITKAQETSETAQETTSQEDVPSRTDSKMDLEEDDQIHSNEPTVVADAPSAPDNVEPNATDESKPDILISHSHSTSSGWFTWFGRSPAPPSELPPQAATEITETANADESDVKEEEQQGSEQPTDSTPMETSEQTGEVQCADTTLDQTTTSTSYWFGFWSSSTTIWTGPTPEVFPTTARAPVEEAPVPPASEDVVMTDATPPDSKGDEAGPKTEPEPVKPPSAGSTWAFWSRNGRAKSRGTTSQPAEVGELAVIGEGSESQPQPATTSELGQPKPSDAAESKKKVATPATPRAKNKRNRPQSMDIDVAPITPTTPGPQDGKPTKGAKQAAVATEQATPPPVTTPAKTPSQAKEPSIAPLPPNLLLPSFRSTYSMKGNPSIMRQITDFLLRTRQPPANHVYRVKEPPRIKKAISIGVHGLFPAAYLKAIIGQPTGTSIRFANLGAEAIRRWAEANGQSDCVIETVALEGEGKIADRVSNLWTLLLNWIDHLRNADLVIVACHSQGVPVSIILLAKLIDLGIIKNAKIGVCAMGTFSS